MSKPDVRRELHWLEDIIKAIRKIQTHPQFPLGKEAFELDEHYRIWVFYHLERVGECVSRLRRDFDYDKSYPSVDWQGAQGMRRYLVHRYWAIDMDAVWKGVEYLPKILEKALDIVQEKRGLP